MKKQIRKWFAWLQEAVSAENTALGRVFSDGRQLWATDGYRLHARQVRLEKSGSVYLDADGLFQVREDGRVPELIGQMPPSLPTGKPVATVVVDQDALLQAVADRMGRCRLLCTEMTTPLLSPAPALSRW